MGVKRRSGPGNILESWSFPDPSPYTTPGAQNPNTAVRAKFKGNKYIITSYKYVYSPFLCSLSLSISLSIPLSLYLSLSSRRVIAILYTM